MQARCEDIAGFSRFENLLERTRGSELRLLPMNNAFAFICLQLDIEWSGTIDNLWRMGLYRNETLSVLVLRELSQYCWPLTVMTDRHTSILSLCGLLARKVTMCTPAVRWASKRFAQEGCASTLLKWHLIGMKWNNRFDNLSIHSNFTFANRHLFSAVPIWYKFWTIPLAE